MCKNCIYDLIWPLCCVYVFDNRGSVFGPLNERWPVEDSGGSRRLYAATTRSVLHWGSLRHLLWQGPLLCVQHQRKAIGTYGGGRQHKGKHDLKPLSISHGNGVGSSCNSICSIFSLCISFLSLSVLSCQLSGVWLNTGMICLWASLFSFSWLLNPQGPDLSFDLQGHKMPLSLHVCLCVFESEKESDMASGKASCIRGHICHWRAELLKSSSSLFLIAAPSLSLSAGPGKIHRALRPPPLSLCPAHTYPHLHPI